ncbi:hypothetical protein ACFQZ4_07730 [Catellatospora coxensis]
MRRHPASARGPAAGPRRDATEFEERSHAKAFAALAALLLLVVVAEFYFAASGAAAPTARPTGPTTCWAM